jgi:Tryptophan-associated transmembrane protein (Trp_oprn_chp)
VNSRAEMTLTVGVIGLGALVAFVAGGRPQLAADGTGVQGSDGSAAATALALVGLAGAGAILLVRGWARVGIGVVVAVAGAGVLAVGLGPRGIGWFAGLAVMLGGLVTTWRGRRWDAPAGRFRTGPRPDRAGARDTWDALDRGEDPTV